MPVNHACAPYTIAGLAIAVYSSLVLLKHGPQVDAAMRETDSKAAVPFPTATFMCSFHFNFGSTHTPSTLSFVSGLISSAKASILTVLARSPLGSLFRLEKCISLYLSGANFDPCLLDHSRHLLCASSSRSQFSWAEFPQVIRFVSSTNPNPSLLSSTSCMPSRSSDMKNRKRIGDMGDPWGMPVFIWIQSLSYPSNATLVRRLCIKLRTYLVIHSGRPFFLSIQRSLSLDTWSYAPLMSKLSIDTTHPFLLSQAVCMQDISSSIAERVDLFLLPPIWFHGKRLYSSAASASFVATTLSVSLASVFSRATGL